MIVVFLGVDIGHLVDFRGCSSEILLKIKPVFVRYKNFELSCMGADLLNTLL